VDVRRADLSEVVPGAESLLSAAELARADRFRFAHDRRRWLRARARLRMLLGDYLDIDPRAVRLTTGEHGKPRLAGDEQLFFNVSHAGDLALFAFASRDVGVDVELPRPAVDVMAVAERTFGRSEAERLKSLDPAEREREFLRAWVRHEAALKCRGSGIGGEVDESGLRVTELDVGPKAAAAVAISLY